MIIITIIHPFLFDKIQWRLSPFVLNIFKAVSKFLEASFYREMFKIIQNCSEKSRKYLNIIWSIIPTSRTKFDCTSPVACPVVSDSNNKTITNNCSTEALFRSGGLIGWQEAASGKLFQMYEFNINMSVALEAE